MLVFFLMWHERKKLWLSTIPFFAGVEVDTQGYLEKTSICEGYFYCRARSLQAVKSELSEYSN